MSQAQKPALLPEHQALWRILELYASKADGLIVGSQNKRQKSLHLCRAEALRDARKSLDAGHPGAFIRFATSKQALPIARRVVRQTNAISHLEKLPDASRQALCKAFSKALEAERLADQKLVERGELFREPGTCSILEYNAAKLRRIQSGLGARKAL